MERYNRIITYHNLIRHCVRIFETSYSKSDKLKLKQNDNCGY